MLATGATTLIVDHRLGPVLHLIDRVVVLGHDGQLLTEGAPAQVFGPDAAMLAAKGIWTPLAARMRLALTTQGHELPAIWQMQDLLANLPRDANIAPLLLPDPIQPGPVVVRLTRAACAPPFGPVVLRDITLALRAGVVLGNLGPNGAGKLTLGACLAGLTPPRAGQRDGPAGAIAFQNPEAHFATDSLRAELTASGASPALHYTILADWGLAEAADQHPFTLSTGQKRRLSLALLTATDRWPLLVLDESTAGLDHAGSLTIARHIRRLTKAGRALAVITHDADFALAVCDRIAILNDGRITAEGPTPDILRDADLLARAGLSLPEAAPLLALAKVATC